MKGGKEEVKQIADELLREWKLDKLQWVVTWNARLRSSAGRCRRGRRQIELNPKIVLHYTREEVVDVMLHEIAHVLTVGGHTKVWCMMFKAIGGSGRRHARRAGV